MQAFPAVPLFLLLLEEVLGQKAASEASSVFFLLFSLLFLVGWCFLVVWGSDIIASYLAVRVLP